MDYSYNKYLAAASDNSELSTATSARTDLVTSDSQHTYCWLPFSVDVGKLQPSVLRIFCLYDCCIKFIHN